MDNLNLFVYQALVFFIWSILLLIILFNYGKK